MMVIASKSSALGADRSLLKHPIVKTKYRSNNAGFTLVETVITIAIIAVAMTGIIAVWSNAAARGADPFWQVKVESLGKIYLDKVEVTSYRNLKSADYSTDDFTLEGLVGYQEFIVSINVEFAGKDFSLPQKKLKKTIIDITSPLGNKQQFVTYRGSEK